MGDWVEAGEHFVEADVIRWKEGVFKPRRGKGKAAKLGERLVIAEVLRQDGEWVYLLVRHCELVAVATGRLPRQIPLLRTGEETKRKHSTIVRGKAERLLWSEESVRVTVSSKFLRGYGTEADD